MWEGELEIAFASLAAADTRSEVAFVNLDAAEARVTALGTTLEDERRACDRKTHRAASAYGLVVDDLQDAIQSRDEALSQAPSAAQAIATPRQKALARTDKMEFEQINHEEELERLHHG